MLEIISEYTLLSVEFFLIYVLPFLVIITIVIFFHELGHYWIARRNGVKVLVFSIGFGPNIGWTDNHGTRWKLSLIPLGGYIQMAGFTENETKKLKDKSTAFSTKSVGVRARILAAGPIANLILAFVLFTASLLFIGKYTVQPIIKEVQGNSPVTIVDLLPGDRILSINGISVHNVAKIKELSSLHKKDEDLVLKINRGEEEIEVIITPQQKLKVNILVFQKTKYVKQDPFSAVIESIQQTWKLTIEYIHNLGRLFTGSISYKELRGPIGIAEIAGKIVQSGDIGMILYFTGLLSMAIGIMNLLPMPPLDGGYLAMHFIETVKRAPLNRRWQNGFLYVGLSLLLILMLFVTYNDIMRIMN